MYSNQTELATAFKLQNPLSYKKIPGEKSFIFTLQYNDLSKLFTYNLSYNAKKIFRQQGFQWLKPRNNQNVHRYGTDKYIRIHPNNGILYSILKMR